eukprot:11183531-Lingulodinium_polyedra.AAC.1
MNSRRSCRDSCHWCHSCPIRATHARFAAATAIDRIIAQRSAKQRNDADASTPRRRNGPRNARSCTPRADGNPIR